MNRKCPRKLAPAALPALAFRVMYDGHKIGEQAGGKAEGELRQDEDFNVPK